ncbi:MAG TPA: hypothetical protein VEH27_03230 [Methylomirabilota bacterium]|nr:hypothetical protein [Methylomirabilota bacterium]
MQRTIIPLLFAILLAACATVPRFEPLDLNAGQWQTQHGHAVWTPESKKPEVTGEIIIATNPANDLMVQFSKNPFNIVTAQKRAGKWQLEYGPEGRRYSGPGEGPPRIIWLRLPELFKGSRPPLGWTVVERGPKTLLIEHPERGERLQVVLE